MEFEQLGHIDLGAEVAPRRVAQTPVHREIHTLHVLRQKVDEAVIDELDRANRRYAEELEKAQREFFGE